MQSFNYANAVAERTRPQSEALNDRQTINSAGGYVHTVSKWDRLRRFLILGSDSNTYYVSARTLTQENAAAVLDCLKSDAVKTIAMIADVSKRGLAPKNDSAIFALALATTVPGCTNLVRQHINDVCRIGTHILQFVNYLDQLRGWGRSVRKIISSWYEDRSSNDLEFQTTKYFNREGWTHADVIKLAHPKLNGAHGDVARWALGKDFNRENVPLIDRMERAKQSTNIKEIIELVQQGLMREHIPTFALNDKNVWDALLPTMGVTALVRNLAKMTSIGLLEQMGNDATNRVVSVLNNPSLIQKSLIHPIALLKAWKTYTSGHGLKGSLTWNPVPRVCEALENAFYLSFKNVKPTNKRILVGIDVSGSMNTPIEQNTGGSGYGFYTQSSGMTAREVSMAMAMIIAQTEQNYVFMAFSGGFTPLNINGRDNLTTALQKVNGLPFDRTDCAQPMIYATQNKIPVDCFMVYTDNETWAGHKHPSVALKEYRNAMGINAAQIVVGMTATNFTIADPLDPLTLDVVGFDASVPDIIYNHLVR